MSAADALRFALQALLGHRLRSFLSLLGVTIGVAAVVALTALGEGASRYITDQFATIGSNLIIVIPGKTETSGLPHGAGGVVHDLTLADAAAIARGVSGARRVAPVVVATETVANGERRRQVPVIGSTHELGEVRRLRVARGQFLPRGEARRGAPLAVLGQTVARELFPGAEAVGRVVRLGGLRVRVIGVLARRGRQLGLDMNEVVIIPVATAMRLFNRHSLFRILVQVHAHADLDTARERIVEIVRERHGEEDITVITEDAVLAAFTSILRALTLALAAIAAISLSVAGVGIMNVMLVSVAERVPEIGLLKACGAGRGQILAVFLAEAALLSSAGGLLGAGTGWLGARLLRLAYPVFEATPPAWAVLASLALSVAVGVASGSLPARRASALDPVVALARR